jgi:peptidoglycan/xylan/chitin deacetylase (PgdA/CDA1 family)
MRMPFGSRNERVLRTVTAAGYRSIHWTLDSGDWRDGATAPGVTSLVLRHTEPGDIVVFHCSTQATARGLPAILDGLSERGLSVVTVSELLRNE